MQIQEVASKHGISVQKILSLLNEAGIEGKQDSSSLSAAELQTLESKLVSMIRRTGPREGTVKVLRPTAGTPIVRKKTTSQSRAPKKGAADLASPTRGRASSESAAARQETKALPSEGRRAKAGSKARNLLRAKRMRESGITRQVPEPPPPPEPEVKPEESLVVEIPIPVAVEEKAAPPVLDKVVVEPPLVDEAIEGETAEEEAAEEDLVLAVLPEPGIEVEKVLKEPLEEAAKPAKGKRSKSKKQKKVEEIETTKERVTTAQEKKVLASIMGRKKGKKQKYKRTKRERAAAVEEAQKEREEKARTTLRIHEATTAADVAHGLDVKPSAILKILLDLGKIVTVNQRLDHECIEIIAEEFGFEVEQTTLMDENLFSDLDEGDDPADLLPCPPVVTVMGHVDHGKTKLLDAIRMSDVTSTEAGGITQHIGAYFVRRPHGEICFLDTPGHEAFTAMRARGAVVTDVVVLVVAADDGIMPQTREAIAHARAANVPILVAINKIDLPGANVERVKQELAAENLVPEDWGGDTPIAEISALKKIGIDQLVELIHIQAELLELKANPKKRAKGTVLEARLEEGQGVVATALIQEGTLSIGDPVVAGVHSGKVRALINEYNQRIDKATPGVPVAILGLSGTPVAGDELRGVSSERKARELAQKLRQIQREREMTRVAHVSLDSLFDRIKEGTVKDLNLVVKGDVDGSVGAVCEAIERIESEKVNVNILHRGVGAVSESDIMLASASDAIVLGFGVTVQPDAVSLVAREGVDVRTYRVIYDAIEDIRKAMLGLLEDERREVVVGKLEVLQIFRSSKTGMILGGEVRSGKIVRGAHVRVIRDDRVVFEGKISTLRRFKDEATEVSEGLECGVGIENFPDAHKGDVLECYLVEKVAATL
jgi:translation initiation factor IF-2